MSVAVPLTILALGFTLLVAAILATDWRAIERLSAAQQHAANRAQAAILDAENARHEAVRLSAEIDAGRLTRHADGLWSLPLPDPRLGHDVVARTPLEAVQLLLRVTAAPTTTERVS